MRRSVLLLAALATTVLLASGVALADSPSDSDDPATKGNPAKNKDFSGLVDIGGGRKIYMECRGKGSPTVVLVSGLGNAADIWSVTADPKNERPVFDEVARFTRVCAYDRPGTTRFDGMLSPSTPLRQPTTAQDGVAVLCTPC